MGEYILCIIYERSKDIEHNIPASVSMFGCMLPKIKCLSVLNPAKSNH